MLRNLGAEPKSPLLQVSNFFIHFSLGTLTGTPSNKKVRLLLFKGIQKADSTNCPYAMTSGSVTFDNHPLQVSIYNFNTKKPNSSQLSLTLYELGATDEEQQVECGSITLPVATLVNTFLEKNEKEKTGPAKLEKKDRIGVYTLKYTVYVDKNRHNIQGYLKVVQPERQKEVVVEEVGEQQGQGQQGQGQEEVEQVGEVEEVREVKTLKDSKMRQINQEEVEARLKQQETEEVTPLPETKNKPQKTDDSRSLMNVTEEQFLQGAVEALVEPKNETPDAPDVKVDKQALGIIKAQSMQAETPSSGGIGAETKEKTPENVQAQKIASSNKKLIGVIAVVLILIYVFFLRSKGATAIKPGKPQPKIPPKEQQKPAPAKPTKPKKKAKQ